MKEFNRDEYISECYSEPAHSVRRPHKHAELIKAWADGAEIQVKVDGKWRDIESPYWDCDEYRINPEPKPDVVRYAYVSLNNQISEYSNLKLTFDGETGELKSAEVLK